MLLELLLLLGETEALNEVNTIYCHSSLVNVLKNDWEGPAKHQAVGEDPTI